MPLRRTVREKERRCVPGASDPRGSTFASLSEPQNELGCERRARRKPDPRRSTSPEQALDHDAPEAHRFWQFPLLVPEQPRAVDPPRCAIRPVGARRICHRIVAASSVDRRSGARPTHLDLWNDRRIDAVGPANSDDHHLRRRDVRIDCPVVAHLPTTVRPAWTVWRRKHLVRCRHDRNSEPPNSSDRNSSDQDSSDRNRCDSRLCDPLLSVPMTHAQNSSVPHSSPSDPMSTTMWTTANRLRLNDPHAGSASSTIPPLSGGGMASCLGRAFDSG